MRATLWNLFHFGRRGWCNFDEYNWSLKGDFIFYYFKVTYRMGAREKPFDKTFAE